MGNALSLAASIAVPLGVGSLIGISMRDEVKEWYPTIKKPSWTPPNWLFGPVWSALYTCIGVASWRVFQQGGGPLPLGLYATQLLLNFAWTPLFFKAHDLKAASIDITVLLGVLGATISEFSKMDRTAAALMLPYLAWTSYATALTYNIWLNNTDGGKKTTAMVQDVADKVHGAAAEATAAAATPFLAQTGEQQSSKLD